ncbi:hypothetical protein GCM10017691_01070 [Pseudonocardia petroleophila]|uniref:Uncharacterized protein n=1 Tax=Pseudonocardia petroleophila TaxID=37331 RepID=A0A7G7MLD4_9PSEU|nr:DUF5677 domain-containing protein [Pseudonocardia petroleophila]QNG53595.1 hypothetical protein H6H00_06460 [Pseudonocardia petroleophila]
MVSEDASFHGPEHVTDLRNLLDELITRWREGPIEATTPRGKLWTLSRAKLIGGLASSAHRLGHAVALLSDQGMHVETAPTARSVLEHGVTVQWLLAYGDEAVWGVLNEEQRQRRNTVATLKNLGSWQSHAEAQQLIDLVSAEPRYNKSMSDDPARKFNEMCSDLDRGGDCYMQFRVLSSLVHPGIPLAERYIERHEPPEIAIEPRPVTDPIMFLYPTCIGLIWAARAMDTIDSKHPSREWLRGQARRLDIPVELKLSEAGIKRRQQDQRARRLAKHAARQDKAAETTHNGRPPPPLR